MFKVTKTALPDDAILRRFDAKHGAHTDCFVAHVAGAVTLEAFVRAFFDSWVFRLERRLLAWAGQGTSDQVDVEALASGRGDALAAWHVEDRGADQILLAVRDTPIRTWIMRRDAVNGTELFFGSAILPVSDTVPRRIGVVFRVFMPFHQVYSRILLSAARTQIARATT